MLHTIQEAILLTGKSRRTIYDHCTSGRLSYSIGPDERRYFETSELIRVYGALRGSAHPEPVQTAHTRTPDNNDLAQAIAAAVAQAVEPLRAEIEKLRETLLRIEYKPDRADPPPQAQVIAPDDPWGDLISAIKSRQ